MATTTVTRRISNPANLREGNKVDFMYRSADRRFFRVTGVVERVGQIGTKKNSTLAVTVKDTTAGAAGNYAAERMQQVDATWQELVVERCESCNADLEFQPDYRPVHNLCFHCA